MKTDRRNPPPSPAPVLAAVLAFGILAVADNTRAADAPKPDGQAPAKEVEKAAAAIGPVEREVDKILAEMQSYLETKRPTSITAFDPFFARFERLYEQHRKERPEEAVMALTVAFNLYFRQFGEPARALPFVERVAKDYADSPIGRNAAESIPRLREIVAEQAEMRKRQEAMDRMQAELQPGKAFPDFDVKDTDGRPLSVGRLKGRVVLVDFWATWCGPCVGEMPNVVATYEKYHDQGFEVIGISLDRDEDSLKRFTERKQMPWPQYFDGLGWENKLVQKYGVTGIPATFLIGPDGRIIGRDLRGPALAEAVAAALAK